MLLSERLVSAVHEKKLPARICGRGDIASPGLQGNNEARTSKYQKHALRATGGERAVAPIHPESMPMI